MMKLKYIMRSELGKILLNPRSDDGYYLQLATIW